MTRKSRPIVSSVPTGAPPVSGAAFQVSPKILAVDRADMTRT